MLGPIDVVGCWNIARANPPDGVHLEPATKAPREADAARETQTHGDDMTIAVRTAEREAGLCSEVDGSLTADSGQQVRDIERAASPDSVVNIDLRRCPVMDV
jgi:hypothetical protein